MPYLNQYHLTPSENYQLAKDNLNKLIRMTAKLEDIDVSISQINKIINKKPTNNISTSEIDTINQLNNGWLEMLNHYSSNLTLTMEQNINKIVTHDTAAFHGYLRNGTGNVETDQGDFNPPMISETAEQNYLQQLLKSNQSATDKALTLMYHNMRQQLFYDGNKRTAIIIANKIMLDNGAGLICLPLENWSIWQHKLTEFYFTNDMSSIKFWTYQNCILGCANKKATKY